MKYFLLFLFFVPATVGITQDAKPLKQLISTQNSGWPMVKELVENAANNIEVLGKNKELAEAALLQIQVSTESSMGAVIYETGGILVDYGWLRILGSGAPKLNRSLPMWNEGKSIENKEEIAYYLVADDVVGGFFAQNEGGLGEDKGNIYYLSPDNLQWEPLYLTYTEFLEWAFTGELSQFYEKLRWETWKEDVARLDGTHAFSFTPFLWTSYEDFNQLERQSVPIQQIWDLAMDNRNQ